ncbi:MAG: hypothetical protein F7B20_02030 [Aeropyrum sp.]|nr:hypothetical protein [Aeropyrum sp.]MCE4616135.1 hypothetical protein [Aeropyrum sp.]
MGRIPKLIQYIVRDRLSMLIYGPPGSGKSLLASSVSRLASGMGLKVCYAYTASNRPVRGAQAFRFKESVDGLDLARTLLSFSTLGCEFIVVDAINEFYRLDPSINGAKILGLASSVLRRIGGYASGVATSRDGVDSTPGLDIMYPFFNIIGSSMKSGENKFVVKVEKPARKLLVFGPAPEGGVTWM